MIQVETLIIGGGLIGSSVALHLARLNVNGVKCVDLDLEGALSSSELNAGGVRATWNHPLNIKISQLSIDYFASFAEEVGYKACGYLWLKTPEQMPAALKARERQISMGWPVEVWDVAELKRRVPFINKTSDLEGAIFAPRDGLVNPNLLKNHYRAGAKQAGATFDDRIWITSAEYSKTSVIVTALKFEEELSHDDKVALFTGGKCSKKYLIVKYNAKNVVNCAGAWAPVIAKILKYPCPSFPVRRQVSIFDCRDVDLTPYGMIVDSSGVYFHPEATNGLAGFGNKDEPHGVNFEYDGEKFFQEIIWPALHERSTSLEKLKHLTGWAGIYEVSPDDSAILGRVEFGEAGQYGRIYESHSYSGHGAMQSYAQGRALAEKIIHDRYDLFDANPLSATRFNGGQLVEESQII